MSPRTLLFGLAAAVVGGTGVWFLTPPAAAQFPGVGRVADPDEWKGLLPPPVSLAGELVMQSAGREPETPSLFVVVSPDKTRVWGYSTEKGEWKKAPLDGRKIGQFQPILGTWVAVVAEGRKVHAFGAVKGEWDTLELPEGSEPQPVMGTDSAEVRTKTSVSVFSARTGKWATVKFVGE